MNDNGVRTEQNGVERSKNGVEPTRCPFCGEVPPVSRREGMAPMVGHACLVLGLQVTVPLHVWNTRAERTCRMTELPTGESVEYDTEEVIYHCEKCHAERAVYDFNENGDVWAEHPRFCPCCGAKVVE